jgi:hypothetical protein
MLRLRDVHERDELLAFKEASGGDRTLQDRFIAASSYSDEWVSSEFTHFRMWYICLAKSSWDYNLGCHETCRRMILSKKWATKHSDPLQSRQTWYCTCEAGYKAAWGVVLEVKFRTQAGVFYFRASAPDDHTKDTLALWHEKSLKPESPEALYRAVPSVAPTLTEIVSVIDPEAGVYRIASREALEDIPQFEWDYIFSFIGATPAAKEPKKPSKKRR